MKKICIVVLFSILLILASCKKSEKPEDSTLVSEVEVNLKNQNDEDSYAIGYNLGKSFKNISKLLNFDSFKNGIKDIFKGNKSIMSDGELQKQLTKFQQNIGKRLQKGEQGSDIKEDTVKKGSYAVGFNMARNIKSINSGLNVECFIGGMFHSMNGKNPILDIEAMKKTMTQFQNEAKKQQEEVRKKMAEVNKTEGERFLAENAKKEGVKVTKSGLQYKILKEGQGQKPKVTDTIEVHYRGTLIEGTEFDSSYKRGESIKFKLGKVIPGWIEGLQLMKVGSKYQLYIPSELAYKERGAGKLIGPNSTLIFEVELLGIEKPEKKSSQ